MPVKTYEFGGSDVETLFEDDKGFLWTWAEMRQAIDRFYPNLKLEKVENLGDE